MSIMATLLVTSLLVAYTGVILWIDARLRRADLPKDSQVSPDQKSHSAVSILIAVHDCPPGLRALLERLANQLGPDDELLVIWDGPLGRLPDIKAYVPDDERVLCMPHPGPKGKKHALAHGIQLARHEWVVQTDADCMVPYGWLDHLRHQISRRSEAGALLLPLSLSTKGLCPSWLERWQVTEFASVMAMTWLTAQLGEPTMANGAAMAYRRSLALDFHRRRHDLDLPSGDDQFLLHDLKARRVEIAFLPDKALQVDTEPEATLSGLIRQRLRWAAKWRHYTDTPTQIVAISIWALHAALLVALGAVILYEAYALLLLWGLKALVEARLIARWERQMGRRLDLGAFILVQLTYSIYVVLIGALATLTPARQTTWIKTPA